MEPIIVGAVVIINHDTYWNCLQLIKKYEDLLSRDLDVKEVSIDTNFANSSGDNKVHTYEEYLKELREATKLYNKKFPIVKTIKRNSF